MKRKLTRSLPSPLFLLLFLLLLSPAALAAGEVGSVTVIPDNLPLTVNGESSSLAARVYVIASDTEVDKTVKWSSSDSKVATVDEKGVVTPEGEGTAVITATWPASASDSDPGISGTCTVTVTVVPVTLVQMNNVGDQLILEPRGSQRVTVTVGPSNASYKTVSWSNSASGVASLTEDGDSAAVIKASTDHPGSSVVTVTSKHNPDARDTLTVIVSGIVFPQKQVTVAPQGSAQLSFTSYGAAKELTDWAWQSSNTDVASVDPVTGVISAGTSEGTTTITCTADDNPLYTDSCEVVVARSQTTIRTSMKGGSLELRDLPINSKCLEATGSSLYYITTLTVSPEEGTLYYGYISEGDTGNGVAGAQRYYHSGGSAGTLRLDEIIFVPKPDFSGQAVIKYTAYTAKGVSYPGEILIDVEQSAEISYSTRGDPVRLRAEDFNLFCQTTLNRSLSYVTFSPPSSRYGTLYYDYSSDGTYADSVSSDEKYYRAGNPPIDNVSFVPADNYHGTFSIAYRGCDTAGTLFRGNVRITVTSPTETGEADISYSAAAGKRLYFKPSDFSAACLDATGNSLDYVRFPTLPSQGILYHIGSSRVTAGTPYYRYGSGRLLEDVSYLPDEDASGAVDIPFTGVDSEGTTFDGTVRVTISGGDSLISYATSSDRRVYFNAGDFSNACYGSTGYELHYARFTSLPASSRGTLYCGSSAKARLNTSYYRSDSGSNSLSDLYFVPDSEFTGAVSIPFQGTDIRGTTFRGTVEITVSDGGTGSSLSYTVRAGQRLLFRTEDFADACYNATGRQLSYVRFTSLPASSQGKLYYNYNSSVSTYTPYYRTDSSRLLEDVSFLAGSRASGTVSIPFQGYNSQGTRFSGSVSILIEGGDSARVPVVYTTSGAPVGFRASDFSAACAPDLPAALSRVRFTAPPASQGKLYLNYVSPTQHSPLSSGTDYTADQLSQIAFVPKARYAGTVSLSYTASDQQGHTFSSVAQIHVSPASSSAYFSDMASAAWAVPSVDFLRQFGVVRGVAAGEYSPGTPMRRGDFILMLSRSFSFPNVGTDSFSDVPRESYYASAIASAKSLGIVTGGSAGSFRPEDTITRQDAGLYLYRCLSREGSITAGSSADLARFPDGDRVSPGAVEAMGALVRSGVFAGDDVGRLNPDSPLNRAEMAAILHRALT